MMGAFPATMDDEETYHILATFLELGISTFVCLQAEFRLDEPERNWRSGIGLRPYIKDATQVLSKLLTSQKSKWATCITWIFVTFESLLACWIRLWLAKQACVASMNSCVMADWVTKRLTIWYRDAVPLFHCSTTFYRILTDKAQCQWIFWQWNKV